jgi:hypothetical protein
VTNITDACLHIGHSPDIDGWRAIPAPDRLARGIVMNTQSIQTEFAKHSHLRELSDSDLNAVAGGHSKFHYVEMNGNTYAVGHIRGQTVMVKVA